jgi:ankyrin repeat protein
LEWLRKTAKDRLEILRSTTPDAQLAEAQLAVAREHGFSSWRALKAHIERLSTPELPDERIVDLFLERVGTGQLDAVREMLTETPVLVNAVGPHPFWGGRPQALHVAIEAKRRDMVDLLLERGADIDGTNDEYDHWSPLMLAINRNVADIRDELIRRGAHVGLPEALMLGDDDRTLRLLERDGLPGMAPNAGSILAFARTPLAIDRLIALGAPTDTRDRWGATPMDAMSRLGTTGQALVRRLIDHGVAAKPADYARLGDRPTLARLIADDPSIASQDAVMMGAVDFSRYDLVRWLLTRGANVNARADAQSRHTALHSAAWNGDLDMVTLLVEAGADRQARDAQYDGTPRGWAETSIEVSNNPTCAAVVAYFDEIDGA